MVDPAQSYCRSLRGMDHWLSYESIKLGCKDSKALVAAVRLLLGILLTRSTDIKQWDFPFRYVLLSTIKLEDKVALSYHGSHHEASRLYYRRWWH